MILPNDRVVLATTPFYLQHLIGSTGTVIKQNGLFSNVSFDLNSVYAKTGSSYGNFLTSALRLLPKEGRQGELFGGE